MPSKMYLNRTSYFLYIVVSVMLILAGAMSACTAEKAAAKVPSVPLPLPTTSPVPIQFQVTPFFTEPAVKGKDVPGWRIINTLVGDINLANQSVDMAMYNFSLPEVGDALIHAAQRGLAVRMVVDSDAQDGIELQRLKNTGIKILGDRRESLMHNKFVIIDRTTVWTGSLNLTYSGSMDDENVLVEIRSTELAANYLSKFNEMFNNDKFGPDSRAKTINTRFIFAGIPVENYFSPEDKISSRLVSLIGKAQKSVHVLAYSFTQDRLADALIKADKNGVDVRGVFDEESTGSNQGADFPRLKKAGLDVKLDGEPGLMHIKAIIIDGKTVAFGSYNYTASAENYNDENVLIITDPVLAGSFEQAFERIYQKSKP
jgi:phosphatidylserine/phosphatidylglycerophosphate/cardiolipin synthase-like enzyme